MITVAYKKFELVLRRWQKALSQRRRGDAICTHTDAEIHANLFGSVVHGGVTFAGSSPAFDLCPRYARSAGVALLGGAARLISYSRPRRAMSA